MMNLNEMTSKQLKELGKENHIKNWWNLSKAALITALSEILNKNDAHEAEPENVEVKTKKQNLHIQTLTFNDRTQTIREWAAELEMPWPTLYDRINRNGWSVEEALTIPLGGRRKNKKELA